MENAQHDWREHAIVRRGRCVNLSDTGTAKVPPLLVGESKFPHCFRGEGNQCPIPYESQKNAWVDREVYKRWWVDVFLPFVRTHTSEPVALLMDNCSGHDVTLEDPLGQVEVQLFPPNSTYVYQPLDQGNMSARLI